MSPVVPYVWSALRLSSSSSRTSRGSSSQVIIVTDFTVPGALIPPQVIEPTPPDPPHMKPPIVHLTQVEGMQRSSHPANRAAASIAPSRAPASTRLRLRRD